LSEIAAPTLNSTSEVYSHNFQNTSYFGKRREKVETVGGDLVIFWVTLFVLYTGPALS